MSKFKVGQQVRVVGTGDTATVRKIDGLLNWPYVIELDEGGTLFVHDDELEAVA